MFCEHFLKVVSKMPYSWENSMKLAFLQPSVTIAKRKISFANMTHGCKGYFSAQVWLKVAKRQILGDFPNIFMKMTLLLKTFIFIWYWQKKNQFNFSFFKVDSQNPKFSFEYLLYNLYPTTSRLHHLHSSLNTLELSMLLKG